MTETERKDTDCNPLTSSHFVLRGEHPKIHYVCKFRDEDASDFALHHDALMDQICLNRPVSQIVFVRFFLYVF